MDENTGSCGCGQVQLKLNADVLNTVNCHCDMCRSHNGAAFSTYAALPLNALEFTQGDDLISEYAFGTAKKHFCGHCGTPIFNTNSQYPGACMLYLGMLANHKALTPAVNAWCESQLSWVNEISSIHSLQQGVPGK